MLAIGDWLGKSLRCDLCSLHVIIEAVIVKTHVIDHGTMPAAQHLTAFLHQVPHVHQTEKDSTRLVQCAAKVLHHDIPLIFKILLSAVSCLEHSLKAAYGVAEALQCPSDCTDASRWHFTYMPQSMSSGELK